MIRLLTLVVLVVLLSTASSPLVSAQRPVQKDFASSGSNYSESKRLYNEGVKYALAKLFAQAAQIFEQAVKLDPQFADAHFALGHAYFDLGRFQEAIDSFQRAIDLNANDQEARDWLEASRRMLARQSKSTTKVAQPATKTFEPTIKVAELKPTASQAKGESVSLPISLNAKPATPPANAADNTNDEANAAATELALTRIYRVGPGDVLDIRINDSSSPQSTLFTVTPAGLLEHPLLAEPLHVGGLTVEEISSSVESDLKRRALMDSPKVSVGVRDYASHTILVSGLVKDSGTKILRREAIPLYVVVADAQPLPEAARVTVVRSEANQMFDIDLSQSGDMNLLVRPGDVITLHANATQFIYIGGEVKMPGETTYRRGLTLTQAIIAAGGVTTKGKEARLGRDDGRGFLNVTRFKLKDIESGKVPDPPVRPGDRIMIVH